MKSPEFSIDTYQAKKFFAPIRSKSDVISLWMNAIKLILAYTPVLDEHPGGKIHIKISKMSRIFFSSPDKIFSINFPFFIKESCDGAFIFSTNSCPDVDNRVTSNILSLLAPNNILHHTDVLDFADPIVELSDVDETTWMLFRDLILCEDGYIRYDHDPDPKRLNGHIHPLNHFDVFYTNSTTFKVGYHDRASIEDITDLLDITTECHYLNKAITKNTR